MKAVIPLALCAAAACGPLPRPAGPTADASPEASDLDAFARTLDSLRTAARIPGLSAAVVRDGEVVFARGFGFADVERRVAATPETPYNIASVAKPISAVVAMKLVEEGKLDLDRPMARYRDFAGFCEGFRAQESVFARELSCDGERMTLRHLLGHTVNGPPGERFLYNPVMYSWASRPMAEVADTPFSELVDRYVFRPAGMERSARKHRRLPLRADLAAALARPYRVDSAGTQAPAPDPPPQGDGAAGGVVSTVLDLARFDVALDGGRLVSPASRAAMMAPARTPDGRALPYGIGWYVQEHAGRTLVWHSGWWPEAYSALYLKVPEEGVTLILLANSEGVWWGNAPDRAEVEKSPFARAFLEHFRR